MTRLAYSLITGCQLSTALFLPNSPIEVAGRADLPRAAFTSV